MKKRDKELLTSDHVLELAYVVRDLPVQWADDAPIDTCRLVAERLTDGFVLVNWGSRMASALLERILKEQDPSIEQVVVEDNVDGEGSVDVGVMVNGQWVPLDEFAEENETVTHEMAVLALDLGRVVAAGRRGW